MNAVPNQKRIIIDKPNVKSCKNGTYYESDALAIASALLTGTEFKL